MRSLKLSLLTFYFMSLAVTLFAGPTSLFWTNCTTDVLETGTLHLNVNNYFTVFNRRGHGQSFPPDVGFTYGLFTWHNMSAEALTTSEVPTILGRSTPRSESKKISYSAMPPLLA